MNFTSDDYMLYSFRGVAYHIKEKYDLSMFDSFQAVEIINMKAGTHNYAGVLHSYDGKYDLAINEYTKGIELYPEDDYVVAELYTNRGDAYAKIGKYNFAIKDYTNLISIIPTNVVFYYKRGLSYISKGNYKKAESDFVMVVQLAPDSRIGKEAKEKIRTVNSYMLYKNLKSREKNFLILDLKV